jgi:hypothetical protein
VETALAGLSRPAAASVSRLGRIAIQERGTRWHRQLTR